MKILQFLQLFLSMIAQSNASKHDLSSYFNPVIPGWHSDPSCIQLNGVYFCVASTFIAFPGLPIYASKDLLEWKLASHVWNREAQLPGVSWATEGQQEGMFAATLRHRDGVFYVICEYLGSPTGTMGVLFSSKSVYEDDSWGHPVIFKPEKIDPDLFWDDDGTVWMATQGIIIQTLDMETGALGPAINIWNGTGGVWPEGPHIYKKDGWYYLLIAEGGTGIDHSITIARAPNITGPYTAYENNPILTNRGTDEYIQNVGHGDLFQDPDGNWWGLCLGVRHGPDGVEPMGRESFLFNATWEEGEWPVLQPVRGKMPGDLLPPPNRDVQGKGPFVQDEDDYSFARAHSIPRHFIYWRVPREGSFSTQSDGLRIVPSRNNLTGMPFSTDAPELSGREGLSFVGRRQTHTLFNFTVNLSFDPQYEGAEAGITVFRTQLDHIDLGLVRSRSRKDGKPKSKLHFRVRSIGPGSPTQSDVVAVPVSWDPTDIRLRISAVNETHYELSASSGIASRARPEEWIVIAYRGAEIVSGGEGSFVGSLVGAYATCNGEGSGTKCPNGGNALIKHWKYEGLAQAWDHGAYEPQIHL